MRLFIFLILITAPNSFAAMSYRASPAQKCVGALERYLSGEFLSRPHALGAEIIIDAAVEAVWKVLEDFESYSQWNPMTIKVQTDKVVGHRMYLLAPMKNGKIRKVHEKLTAFEENFCISWKVPFPENALAGGERWQILVPLENHRTLYVSFERFRGMFAGYAYRHYGQEFQEKYNALVLALKARVEEKAL